MGQYREELRAHEEAVLGALRRLRAWPTETGFEDGAPAAAIYGWAVRPTPDGWRLATAETAARRLEARGELVAVRGDRFNPRRWRLPERAG